MAWFQTRFLDGEGGQGGGGGEPADGAPGGEPPVGGAPLATEPKPFDRAKLHPAIRDMAPEEITELFEQMAGTLRTVQARPTQGEDGLDSSGVPAHARPVPPREPPKPPSRDEYKEMLDPTSDKFDPESAFRRFADANYGQLFGDINARALRGVFGSFRSQFPDFKDYEADVTQALAGRDPATLTERDVLNTYFGVKGMRLTLKERQAAGAAGTGTAPPSPPVPPAAKDEELDALSEEVAQRMFRHVRDPKERIAKYRQYRKIDDEGPMTVKVPVGGGKVE